jgi:hypothetical protein
VRGVGRPAFPSVERERESSAGRTERAAGAGDRTRSRNRSRNTEAEQRAARLSRAGDDRAGSTGSSQAAGKSRYWGVWVVWVGWH